MKCLLLFLALPALAAAAAIPAPDVVGFEQRNGEQLPLGTLLTDARGVARPFGAYFGTRPVVLIFNYFRCPVMCSLVSSGAIDALRALRSSAGSDYEVVTVSIDPTDTPAMAAEREREDVAHYGRTGAAAGWHTLVGAQAQVAALAAAAGFHYRFDPRSGQYAHPSGLIVVSPRGVVSRYFMGVDFPAGDLAEALRDAGANRTGDSVFSLLFVCFQGNAAQGQYSRAIWIVLWASVAATLLVVFGGIAWMLHQERRARMGGLG
jgi:protein SCO1/2